MTRSARLFVVTALATASIAGNPALANGYGNGNNSMLGNNSDLPQTKYFMARRQLDVVDESPIVHWPTPEAPKPRYELLDGATVLLPAPQQASGPVIRLQRGVENPMIPGTSTLPVARQQSHVGEGSYALAPTGLAPGTISNHVVPERIQQVASQEQLRGHLKQKLIDPPGSTRQQPLFYEPGYSAQAVGRKTATVEVKGRLTPVHSSATKHLLDIQH